MAKLGRGDEPAETSLAAATAAIITARWNEASRRAWQPPEPRRGGAHEERAMAGRASVATSPPAPYPYPGSGYAGSAGADAGANGFATNGYSANGYSANGYPANGHAANGYAPASHATNGYESGDSYESGTSASHDGAPAGGANGHAVANGHGLTDGYEPRGYEPTASEPTAPAPSGYDPTGYEPSYEPERDAAFFAPVSPAPAPPPLFTPTPSTDVPDIFPDRDTLDRRRPDRGSPDRGDPAPVSGASAGLASAAGVASAAVGAAAPRAGVEPEFEAPALARPFASMPARTAPAPPPVDDRPPRPAARAELSPRADVSPLDAPLAAPLAPPSLGDFPANSVMSDLVLPKPFIPEPYEGFGTSTQERRLPPPLEPRAAHGVAAPVGPSPRVEREREPEPRDELPRRVPSVPDIPDEVLATDGTADDGFELSRIASYLRDERIDATDQRPDGFDMMAVVEAVRRVPQVSDAALRWTPGYGHTLRIEYQDGVDEEQVTRHVARILKETMGLEAQAGPFLASDEPTVDRTGRSRGSARVPTAARLSDSVDRQPGRPLPRPAGGAAGVARVVLDHVQVTTLGVDATVEVRLAVSGGGGQGGSAVGQGSGPAVDAYLLRLAAGAAGDAVDQLLLDPATGAGRGRLFVEHVAVVPFGSLEVAVVVLLLVCGGFAEQLAGSAIVAGDPREAVVRATLSAVNRRLESLLA